jgi:hypothetical protein
MKNTICWFLLFFSSSVSAQVDSIKSHYLTQDSVRQDCILLLSKAKRAREINQYRFIEIINPQGKYEKLYADSINGYFSTGVYFKSFTVNFMEKRTSFFAKQVTSGAAVLYYYNGENLNYEPIYVFKKLSDFNYIFVQKNLKKYTDYGTTNNNKQNTEGDNNRGNEAIKFMDEQPYVGFFPNYLSDCILISTKFKAGWYSFSNIELMFKDYNQCN